MAPDERQPLLERHGFSDTPKSAKSLPWTQITILCIWRASHAIYFAYILPWITRFLINLSLADASDVGRVAGWVESAYSLGVLTGLAPASYISDAFGRKPTLLIGVICASIGTVLFGFGTSLWQLIVIRYTNGIFIAFLPASVMTMLIELSTPETLPMAFSLNSFAWTLGNFIAPSIGGFLAEPAIQYPGIFKGTIWEVYPYALPGVVATSIPLLSAMIGLYVINETLPKAQRRSLRSFLHRSGAVSGSNAEVVKDAPLRGLFTRATCYILFLWLAYVIIAMGFVVTEVLFLSTPVSGGGLGFAPRDMGILYSVRPLITNAVVLVVYPHLARRYATEKIFQRSCAISWTIILLSYFIFGISTTTDQALSSISKMVILFALSIPLAASSVTGTSCMQTVSSRAPNKLYLTRMNTAAEYSSNSGHGLGAILGSNVWAHCVKYNLLHGQAVWLFLLGGAWLVALLARRLTVKPGWKDAEEEEVQITVEAEGEISSQDM